MSSRWRRRICWPEASMERGLEHGSNARAIASFVVFFFFIVCFCDRKATGSIRSPSFNLLYSLDSISIDGHLHFNFFSIPTLVTKIQRCQVLKKLTMRMGKLGLQLLFNDTTGCYKKHWRSERSHVTKPFGLRATLFSVPCLRLANGKLFIV